MGKYFEVQLNDKEITETLNKASKQLKDLTPMLKIARKSLLNAIDENFETEGESSGGRFKQWSDKYAQTRAKKRRGLGKILQLEGDLRKSITSKIGRRELIIGTAKEYAAAHQFGYAPRNLDARPFMRISDAVKKEIARDIAADLRKRIAK